MPKLSAMSARGSYADFEKRFSRHVGLHDQNDDLLPFLRSLGAGGPDLRPGRIAPGWRIPRPPRAERSLLYKPKKGAVVKYVTAAASPNEPQAAAATEQRLRHAIAAGRTFPARTQAERRWSRERIEQMQSELEALRQRNRWLEERVQRLEAERLEATRHDAPDPDAQPQPEPAAGGPGGPGDPERPPVAVHNPLYASEMAQQMEHWCPTLHLHLARQLPRAKRHKYHWRLVREAMQYLGYPTGSNRQFAQLVAELVPQAGLASHIKASMGQRPKWLTQQKREQQTRLLRKTLPAPLWHEIKDGPDGPEEPGKVAAPA